MKRHLHTLAWMGLGALLGVLLFAFRPVANALPEYATRTGEPCSTCHVNPAGGGPRTVRAALWVAAGRPDVVPSLPGAEPAAGAASATGAAGGPGLYAGSGCGGCHGAAGEGGAGPALNRGELPAGQLRDIIRNGKGAMMGFKTGALPDTNLAALVAYVQAIGRGEVEAPAPSLVKAREPARAICGSGAGAEPGAAPGSCGGN